MTTSPSSPPPLSERLRDLGRFLRTELLGLARTCFRTFLYATLGCAVLLFLDFAWGRFFGSAGPPPPAFGDKALELLLMAGFSLFYAAYFGLVCGVLAGLWRLFGAWMFFPVAASLAILLALTWLFEGMLMRQLEDVLIAAQAAAVASVVEFTDMGLGRVMAHGGGAVGLVFVVPILLVMSIRFVTYPLFVLETAEFLALMGALLALAAVLSVGVCLPVLLRALIRRARARRQLAQAVAGVT